MPESTEHIKWHISENACKLSNYSIDILKSIKAIVNHEIHEPNFYSFRKFGEPIPKFLAEKGELIQIEICEDNQSKASIISLSIAVEQFENTIDTFGISIDINHEFVKGIVSHCYEPVNAWTIPISIDTPEELPESNNLFFLWKNSQALYGTMIPLVALGYQVHMGRKQQYITATSSVHRSQLNFIHIPILAIHFDYNPYKAVEKVYEFGLEYIGLKNALRKNKIYPALFDKWMWCTWNSLGTDVSASKIVEQLEIFTQKNIQLPNLLIDDGWQCYDPNKWGVLNNWKVEMSKFPMGLKQFNQLLKEKYSIEHIGIWHTINGYWAGINPDSDWGEKIKKYIFEYQYHIPWAANQDGIGWFIAPNSDGCAEFYKQWYQYLTDSGIDFVKIDNQQLANQLEQNHISGNQNAQLLQLKLRAISLKYFNNQVLNCMNMNSGTVFYFGAGAVGRSSEDYFPNNFSYNIKAGNAAVHILCNAHNALWWSQMVYPDYDMFQTHHPHAMYHAVARALSGGPIYITDQAHFTQIRILEKLTLSTGKILRSENPALPSRDCLFQTREEKAFKIQGLSNNSGLLAAFNTTANENVKGYCRVSDIENLVGEQFLVYEHFSKSSRLMTRDDSWEFELGLMDCKLFIARAIEDGIAYVGLKEKFNAPQTVSFYNYSNHILHLSILDKGEFLSYAATQPLKVIENTKFPIPFHYEKSSGILTIKLERACDLTIEF
jgi:hypothetical protein